ncbi:MAG: AzlD domain-containing protein [Burkholderiales bacterium]|nr:AzlD domain-containing protein [Burkholderiales bacterium]
MSLWLTMLAAGAVTFAIRVSFIGLAGRFSAPPWFSRMLRFVPVAALTALVWPDLLVTAGAIAPDPARLGAGVLAALVAWHTRNILLTIACGMAALWLFQWVLR